MNPRPTLPAAVSSLSPTDRALHERASGLRRVAEVLGAGARWALGTGTKWALYLVAAGLVSYCTLVGLPRRLQMMDGRGTGAVMEAALDPGASAEGA